MIHTVKGFGLVNKAEIDVVLELSCFFYDPSTRDSAGSGATEEGLTSRGGMEKAREFQNNIYFCFIDYAKAFDCVDHNKLWKILITFHFHALEEEMAPHSSILARRIPWTEEPGGLQSMGSHRGGHH